MVEAVFSSPEGAPMLGRGVSTCTRHEADLRNALGLPVDVPADFLALGRRRGCATGSPSRSRPPGCRRCRSTSATSSGSAAASAGAPRTRCAPTRGRSTPTPYLDHFFIFGRAERSLGER